MRDVIETNQLRTGRAVGVCGFLGSFTAAIITDVTHHHNHLGGQWATMTLELPGGEVVEGVDSRQYVFVTPDYSTRSWCPQCGTRREVEEESDESSYEGRWEVGYRVTRMVCGHSVQSEGRRVGVSPGGESAREAEADAATRQRLARAGQAQS